MVAGLVTGRSVLARKLISSLIITLPNFHAPKWRACRPAWLQFPQLSSASNVVVKWRSQLACPCFHSIRVKWSVRGQSCTRSTRRRLESRASSYASSGWAAPKRSEPRRLLISVRGIAQTEPQPEPHAGSLAGGGAPSSKLGTRSSSRTTITRVRGGTCTPSRSPIGRGGRRPRARTSGRPSTRRPAACRTWWTSRCARALRRCRPPPTHPSIIHPCLYLRIGPSVGLSQSMQVRQWDAHPRLRPIDGR